MPCFSHISPIQYEGCATHNPLAYRYYNPNQIVLGKTMKEHLRIAVCLWHTFAWRGNDMFGDFNFERPWYLASTPMKVAEERLQATFEFIEKLGVPYFTFHDRDVAPEGKDLVEFGQNLNKIADKIQQEMERTGIKLLWGTANMTGNPRYASGASTNPDPHVFGCAVAQVKAMIDVTHRLNGENYVLWGGREGYETLLNTDYKQEQEQMGRFFSMLVDYKHKIGFQGTLLIEPKPCEPSKHQYDFDVATVYAFLQKWGLQKEYKVNIEANHATMAGHTFSHEVAVAISNGIFGSIDANQGDPQLGWDTDQFPTALRENTLAMYYILQDGGFKTGGFNLDAKVRRQSCDLDDLFYGHISGIDTLARCLLSAATLIEEGHLDQHLKARYAGWKSKWASNILGGKETFETIAKHVISERLDPHPISGRQEMLEIIIDRTL